MSSRDRKDFIQRKSRVEQALMSQKHYFTDDFKGIATARQLQELTGLNEQAIRRIINALEEEGKIKVVKDKSEIVLLK